MAAADRSNAGQRHIFPWAKLSGELRNAIYAHALAQDTPISFSFACWKYPPIDRRRCGRGRGRGRGRDRRCWCSPNVALLRVDRATHAEAQPLLFRLNAFHFDGTVTFERFMAALPARFLPHLRHVSIGRLDLFRTSIGTGTSTSSSSTGNTIDSVGSFWWWLARAPNLRCVELGSVADLCWILVNNASFERNVAALLSTGAGLRWLRAIGAARGEPAAGADVVRLDRGALVGRLRLVGVREAEVEMRAEEEMREFRAALRDVLQADYLV